MEGVEDKGGDVAGYMPLQRQVGFIYDSPNLFIIAHELGHGAFNLRHTFSPESFIAAERTTQNLMDYNGGTELWKHQWELIRDPQNIWFAWAQEEGEGEAKDDRNIVIAKTKEFLPSINNLDVEFKINHGNIGLVTAQIINNSKELLHEEVFPTPVKDNVNYLYTWDGKMNKNNNDLISEEKFIVSIIQGSKDVTHPDLFGKTKDEKEVFVDYTKVQWEKSNVKTWACINSRDYEEYKKDIENKVYNIGFDLLDIEADSPYRKNPLKYVEDNVIETSFFGNKIYVHKMFAEELNQIEKNCSNIQPLSIQITSSFRIGNTLVKDKNENYKLSDHCLGLAIDLNPSDNPYLSRKCDKTNNVDVLYTIDALCQISTDNSIVRVKDPLKLFEINRLFLEKFKKDGFSSKDIGNVLSSNYISIGTYLEEKDNYTYKNLSESIVESNINSLIDNFNDEKMTEQEFCDQLKKIKERLTAFESFNSVFNSISFIKDYNLSAYSKLNDYILNTKNGIDNLLSSHVRPLNSLIAFNDNGIAEYLICFNKIQSLTVDFKTFGLDLGKIVNLGKDRGALVFDKGFFNIDLDLIRLMLESGKLDWGASYGDYMHFNFKKSNIKQ